jgi:hypothetical protein
MTVELIKEIFSYIDTDGIKTSRTIFIRMILKLSKLIFVFKILIIKLNIKILVKPSLSNRILIL